MNKIILSDNREIEVKPAKVGMVSNAQKMYKTDYEREMYIVSQCASIVYSLSMCFYWYG